MRGHLAVGYMTLNHVTLVRIQAPQLLNFQILSYREPAGEYAERYAAQSLKQ